MGRDKSKDDKYFNCSQNHELVYVAGLYKENLKRVYDYLKVMCENGSFYYATHRQVYEKIEQNLGLPMPN